MAAKYAAGIYGELQKDPSIRGAGIIDKIGGIPLFIVPREEFEFRSTGPLAETIIEKRERIAVQQVAIVSPFLLPKKRKWKFRTEQEEFSARVTDDDFIRSLLSGKTRVPMKSGVELLVKIKFNETKENGMWVIKDREIIKVIKVIRESTQGSLSFPAADKKDG